MYLMYGTLELSLPQHFVQIVFSPNHLESVHSEQVHSMHTLM